MKNRKSEIGAPEMLGKLPPHSLEIEKAVLGAIMLVPDTFSQTQDKITAEAFYAEKHRAIFKSIERIYSEGAEIDLVSVLDMLERLELKEVAGGHSYVAELTLSVTGTSSIAYWCALLNEKYVAREMIKISMDAMHKGYESDIDVFDEISTIESKLMKITSSVLKRDVTDVKTVSDRLIEQLKIPTAEMIGIPSGIPALDKILGGWNKTNLIILAARPSVGKSVLAANYAAFAAIHSNVPTVLFSLEMSSNEFLTRIYSAETDIPGDKLKYRNLDSIDWERIQSFRSKISDAPLFLDDTPSISIMELRAKSIRLKQKHDIGLIVIDYLQLMKGQGKSGNREGEIGEISRGLKALAKEIDVPIIALAQLSRELEKRADKRPMLSDLRESGSIEQDADVVLFLSRPEIYDIDQIEINSEILSTVNLGVLDVAKHRNGKVGTIPLKFQGHVSKFVDYKAITYKQPPDIDSPFNFYEIDKP